MNFYQSLTKFIIYITLNGIKKNLSYSTTLPAGWIVSIVKGSFLFTI